jgi:hypothetical protein
VTGFRRGERLGRRVVALALAGALGGCALASARQVASVTPLPRATPLRDQPEAEQKWDEWECREQVRERTAYNTYDSPMANVLQKLFFWGTAGASVGGLFTGMPVGTDPQLTDGVIAGVSAGGVVGAGQIWEGQTRYERVWVECMQARGYAVAPPGADASPPSVDASPPAVSGASAQGVGPREEPR